MLFCAQVVIKNAIAVAGIVGDIETTPQFPVTNYKIARGLNPNDTISAIFNGTQANGTRGNRTARIKNPRTNRTALAKRPEAAPGRKAVVKAISQRAGRLVGVGLALPQVPQRKFASRRYSQQVRPSTRHSSCALFAAAVYVIASRYMHRRSWGLRCKQCIMR
jgi:hypothetical protein